VEKLSTSEIVTVLAHEMGHYTTKHIFTMMGASILQTGIMFYILSLFINNEGLFDAFGMEHPSISASLIFFGFLYAPISMLLGIIFNAFSRRNEYEADAFAVKTTSKPDALITGLKKLSVSNLANLTPHPLHVFLNYSHPPILERIRALKDMGGGAPTSGASERAKCDTCDEVLDPETPPGQLICDHCRAETASCCCADE